MLGLTTWTDCHDDYSLVERPPLSTVVALENIPVARRDLLSKTRRAAVITSHGDSIFTLRKRY